MWRKRTALLTAAMLLVTAGAVVGRAAPAWAGGRGEQIIGDVNGDGFTDRVTLGVVDPDFCSVIVEYGTPSGDYRLPAAYVYLRPGGSGPSTRCPELGVAIDLDTDRTEELVVAWYPGPPPTLPYNLMVLNTAFQPSFGLVEAVFAPYYLGEADFNGDGRQDVYSVTDQGQGIETYLNLGNGTLTPGPAEWCARPIQYELSDLDVDGRMDFVNSYTERCLSATFASGVTVVLDDGTPLELERDPIGMETWTVRVTHLNADRLPDIRTVSRLTGEVDYFINTGGRYVQTPQANTDTVYLTGTRAVTISVLANDWATSAATVTITSPPRYGTAQVISGGRIVYRPRANHGTTDRFTYQLTDDGRRSSAVVYIRWTG
ncbi:Ig-like domain-containing protein [Plantactinospora sonchi]|uniref:FG-GAP-like repeat-containing protein n=1 Tax=Plantactinospora sonchi TaxID=1544735 RepID=A0ABU7RMV7_9ACTN